jgi:hypothetical protein
MRLRSALMAAALLGLSALVAAPAGAAPAQRTTYITGECYRAMPEGTAWTTGQASHWDGNVQYVELLYDANAHAWTGPIGTEDIHVTLMSTTGGTVTMHGTYTFRSPLMGDFDGTWSQGNRTLGHASGRSVDGGELVTTVMGLDPTGYPAAPQGCFGFQVNEWQVLVP